MASTSNFLYSSSISLPLAVHYPQPTPTVGDLVKKATELLGSASVRQDVVAFNLIGDKYQMMKGLNLQQPLSEHDKKYYSWTLQLLDEAGKVNAYVSNKLFNLRYLPRSEDFYPPLPAGITQAVQNAEKNIYEILNSQSFLEIVKALCKEEIHIDNAIKIAERINPNHRGQRSLAFLQIVEVFVQKNEIQKAVKIAREISHELYKSKALIKIVEALCKQNRIDTAIQAAEQMVEMYSERGWKSSALAIIVDKLLEVNHVKRAIKIALQMNDKSIKSFSFGKIITKLLELGDIDNAVATAERLTEGPYTPKKSEILQLIVYDILNQEGDTTKAARVADMISNQAIKEEAFKVILSRRP